jgi:hypothetical protein
MYFHKEHKKYEINHFRVSYFNSLSAIFSKFSFDSSGIEFQIQSNIDIDRKTQAISLNLKIYFQINLVQKKYEIHHLSIFHQKGVYISISPSSNIERKLGDNIINSTKD